MRGLRAIRETSLSRLVQMRQGRDRIEPLGVEQPLVGDAAKTRDDRRCLIVDQRAWLDRTVFDAPT